MKHPPKCIELKCSFSGQEIDRERVQEEYLLLVDLERTTLSSNCCLLLYKYNTLTDCTIGSINNTFTNHHILHKRSCTIFGPSQNDR